MYLGIISNIILLQVAAHSPSPFVELSQPSSFDNCSNMSLTQTASQLKQAGTVPGLGQLGAAGMKFKLSFENVHGLGLIYEWKFNLRMTLFFK